MEQGLGGSSHGVWRAGIPAWCVAAVFATVAMSELGVGGLALAFVFVLAGGVRVGYWQLHLGRRHLMSTETALVFEGPSGVVREARWADIAEVRLVLAPRYAEWTRLGATSQVMVTERDPLAARGPSGEFATVLALGPERGLLHERLLDVCHRHGVQLTSSEQQIATKS